MADEDAPLPFGISAATGRPLPALADDTIGSFLSAPAAPAGGGESALAQRAAPGGVAFGLEGGLDAENLAETGWGVMFAPGVSQQIKDAVQPLIEHRRQQGAAPLVIFDGAAACQPGESAVKWLTRQGASLNVVDPNRGVPFYLLLVGSPEAIPFEFQYTLDIYWAVGRIWFDTPDRFRQYADSVVAYDTAASVDTSRQIAMFAPQHDFDAATQLFNRQVAVPLRDGDGPKPVPVGTRQKYKIRSFLQAEATKDTLGAILRGQIEGGRPALLFSGGHGMAFDRGDARQRDLQGALVCQDWSGVGDINASHWFGHSDVPANAAFHGLVHVLFACYGGGCPTHDEFDRMNGTPKQIADAPFFSRLPQALLTHENGGALAVLAHIERAWAYSFQGERGGSQVQGFRDVITRLMRGERIGQATDAFNMRWAALSTELAQQQLNLHHGAPVPTRALGRMWVAREDARNYMIFGDPAVRIREEDMPELPA